MSERENASSRSGDNEVENSQEPVIPSGDPEGMKSDLRERAERLLALGEARSLLEGLDEHDMLRLMHELQVHQVELEMQNEELRRAQVELALSAERYADLYDFAPVGYISVGADGRMQRVNLTAAAQLGMERREITGRFLYRFVAPSGLAHFQALRRRLVVPELTESAELLLQPAQGGPFWARLEILTRPDPRDDTVVWQVAISDIDAQKRAELLLQRVNDELEQQVLIRTQELTVSNQQLIEEVHLRAEAEAGLREREELLDLRVTQRTHELATLLSVARDMSATLHIDEILQIILIELRRIVKYDGCGIFLLHGGLLTLVAYRGPLDKDGLLQSQTTLNESPLLKRVVDARRPLIVPDIFEDEPPAREWRQHAGSLQRQLLGGSRCWMGIPMIAQGQVIGVLRMDHGQTGFLTNQHADLALILASQAAIAVVNARLYERAQRVAAVEERERLARELHDSVAQTFYSIVLVAHSAKQKLGKDPGLAERRLDHILDLADAGLVEMKALIFDLQAEGIRRDGLVHALQRQIAALAARNDISITTDLGTEPDSELEAKEAIYGIVREAMQNVVRHSAATEVSLKLRGTDDRLAVEVRDNGKGFSPETAGERTFGLRSMRERAYAAGGTVKIESTPGEGTLVRAEMPVRPGATA